MIGSGERFRATVNSPLNRWLRGQDAVSLLSAFAVLLICLPSRLVLAPLGAAGTPAQLVGLSMLTWWVAQWAARAHPDVDPVRADPIICAQLLLVAAVMISYVKATTRPIDAVELAAADRGVLSLFAWTGIILLAGTRVASLHRLDVLLRRIVALGAGLATLGMVQFFTGQLLTDRIVVPGLSVNTTLQAAQRQGFFRPAGTATHPIEFGVVLAMLLPVALHYAMTPSGRGRVRTWYPAGAIAMAILLSISRSAVLAAVVALLLLLPTWPKRRRRVSGGLGSLLLLIVFVVVPGLLGTFRDLIFGINADSSALSRTGSYETAWRFIRLDPIFGRGFGTFLPSYRILDNQYLGVTIETGLVGLACLVALFVAGVAVGVRLRRSGQGTAAADLAQSLAASVAAGACGFATFDAFSFPMVAGLMATVLGCLAALQRLHAGADLDRLLRAHQLRWQRQQASVESSR